MKNGLLFLLLLLSGLVKANTGLKEHAVKILFAKPTITSIDAKAISPVTVIDDRDIIFVGKADAGRPVRLFRGTINIGQVNADNAGNFSFSVSSTTDSRLFSFFPPPKILLKNPAIYPPNYYAALTADLSFNKKYC